MTAKKSARQHARERGALDGADAQALEGALTIAERERDEARQRLERLLDSSAEGSWMARALDAERERDEWRSECASISEEFNLPAGIRPSEGEISRFLKDYEKARKERDEALAKYQFMVDRAADEKLDGYRELASRLAAMEADRDAWKAAARPPLDAR